MSLPTIRLAVDAVVFGYEKKEGISVLLIQRKINPFEGHWALPGGLVEEDESLERAVQRELQEETGIEVNYLEQLYSFGAPNRDPRNRVVSIAYYGLVRPSKFKLHAATDAADAQWFLLNELPKLAFDHDKILAMAVARLRAKISYEPIGFELLEETFPFSDLHLLYQTLYDKPIDRRNFKRKFLQLNILEETADKSNKGVKGRPGSIYRFNKEKYFQLKKKGMVFTV